MKTCSSTAELRAVVLARGRLGGHCVRIRLQLPFAACAAHARPGACWATPLRTLPRAFAALLANFGVAVPHWVRARTRFVRIRLHAPRASRRDPSSAASGIGGVDGPEAARVA